VPTPATSSLDDGDAAASGQPIARSILSKCRRSLLHSLPITACRPREFADPAASPLAERVRADGDHDPGWIGLGGSLRRTSPLADELSQRMAAAHNAGYSISTLSLSAGAVTQQPDLLVQHESRHLPQATARLENTRAGGLLATPGGERPSKRKTSHRRDRCGGPVARARGLIAAQRARRTRQRIEQVEGRALLHCRIDVSALLDRNGRTLRTLDAALTYIRPTRRRKAADQHDVQRGGDT
jgi:hypothetical protein